MVSNTILTELYAKKAFYLQYIMGFNISPEICEDIFQDSVIALHQSKCDINNPLGYFKNIVRNQCAEYIRKNKIKMVDLNTIDIPDDIDKPELNLDKINDLLGSLDDDMKFIINEFLYESKTRKQISEENNININTLNGKFRKLICKLKNKYDKIGIVYFFE